MPPGLRLQPLGRRSGRFPPEPCPPPRSSFIVACSIRSGNRLEACCFHGSSGAVPVTLPLAPNDNHVLEWLQACKGGPATFTGLDVGCHSAEVYLPGMIALRLGRTIQWDGPAMKATNAPEADPLI